MNVAITIALPGYYELFIGVTALILGSFVLISNPKQPSARLFFLLALFIGLTSVFAAALDLFGFYFNYIEKLFVLLYPLMGSFVPICLLLFTLLFPERPRWLKKSILIIFTLPTIYFIWLAVTDRYFYDIYVLNRAVVIKRTPAYLIYCTYSLIIYTLFLIISFSRIKKLQQNIHIKQLKTIFLGGIIGGGAIVIGMFLTYLGFSIYGYETGTLIYIISTCYAITKYQAFDIRSAFHYSLFWGGSIGLLILPIIGIPLIFKKTFLHYHNPILLVICWGILIVLYCALMNKMILPWINRITLRRKATLSAEAQRLIERINRCTSFEQVTYAIQYSLQNNLYPEDSLILFLNEKNILVGSFNNMSGKIEVPVENFSFLNEFDELLTSELIQDLGTEAHFFHEHHIVLVSKLVFEEKLLGLLCLKQKRNFKPYRIEERRFIQTISQGLAALFNKNLLVQRASDVASEIIHEIKNTVQSLEFTLSDLTSKTVLNADDKEQLHEVFSELTKLHQFSKKHLTLEMLNKMEAMEQKDIDVTQLINEATSTIQFQLNENQMIVRINIPEKIKIFGDQILLKIVFVNLLENAVKFSDHQGFIDILYTENEQTQIISIQDYGKGIPEEQQAKLFKKWVKDGSGKYMSSGFGLALSRNIILKHNGKLTFKSEVNKGTIFSIHLPRRLN